MKASERILNPDGSPYHIGLLEHEWAPLVLLVGDPDRVPLVSAYFDEVLIRKSKREICTHTGHLNGHKLMVISTGMGTDNIDIVLNELDALAALDFKTGEVLESPTPLTFVRLGTSGAAQADLPVDSIIMAEKAVGFDNLLHFYNSSDLLDHEFSKALIQHLDCPATHSHPYVVAAHSALISKFSSTSIQKGIIATQSGFYGPQGRQLRLPPKDPDWIQKLTSFRHQGQKISNLDMETAGIYGLAALMGHRALSVSAILANRIQGTFSSQPSKTIDEMIRLVLKTLTA